ncbi:MAG: ATP-binding protein, partial [Candidatus Lokiarchaeia archaeon]
HIHTDQEGNLRYYEVHGFPIFDGKGKVIKMIEYNLDITERKKAENELKKIEWLMRPNIKLDHMKIPEYGDLTQLNEQGMILNMVGKDFLTDIVSDFMRLLGTSVAVYEKNGDYALGLFASTWCRFLDNTSRKLCKTDDNQIALKCGVWHCHESCWTKASKESIKRGISIDIECDGGIHIFATPIIVNKEIIGNINIGYGDPPSDNVKLQEIAEKYNVDVDELKTLSSAYEKRPAFIINLAKKQLITSASLIGEIVDRKISEQKLLESEEKFRTITEQSILGICIIQDEKILYANEESALTFGFLITEDTSWPIEDYIDFINPKCNNYVIEQIKNCQDSKEFNKHFEFQGSRKTGERIWIEIYLKQIIFNEKPAVLCTLKNVTDKKEIEEIKSNLLTRISHEFKTPLISIKGFADLLLSEHYSSLDKKMATFLEKIVIGCKRLEHLLKNFFESSHLDNGNLKLKIQYNNLSNLIIDSLEQMEGLIDLRKHSVFINIEDDIITKFDKKKISNVFLNLLINAINYTPIEGEISIHSEITKDVIIISVQDDGIGLNEDEKNQLFKPFGKIERYGEGWEIITEGIGMGLFIAKEIIELHGGKIWVESEGRGKGSVFSFSLPIVKK